MARAGLKKAPVNGPAVWEEKRGQRSPCILWNTDKGLGPLLPAFLDWGSPTLVTLDFVGSRKAQCRTEGLQQGTFQGNDPSPEPWL